MSDFSHSLPMALFRAREATMALFVPIFRTHDITEQQWRIIRALMDAEDNCLDVSSLTRACHILQPSISRILCTLESRNLVRRQAHAGDQRYVLIVMTQEGKNLFGAIMPVVEEGYAEIAARIGQSDLNELFRISHKIILNLKGCSLSPADGKRTTSNGGGYDRVCGARAPASRA